MIDQFLVAAIIHAQNVLDLDEAIKADIVKHFKVNQPYIAVFTEVPIGHTKVQCGNTSCTFHGLLDYGIGFIPMMQKSKLVVLPPFIFLLT
jgi:hypothetical protein